MVTRIVTLLWLLACCAPAQMVEKLAATVEREYFDVAIGARVATALRAKNYEGLQEPALIEALNKDLYELSHDKHLAVSLIPEARESRGPRTAWGVQKVELVAGGACYLNLTGFERGDAARENLGAAMTLMRNCSRMIVDLRDNGGGAPDTAALFLSYLLGEPGTALFDIVDRAGQAGKPYKTEAVKDVYRGPVFLLTSEKTFSAGEGVAFLLQERKRVTVIGEQTPGAANPGRPYPLTERLVVVVPNGRVRSAYSGKNWEGTGVKPDIPVSAERAFAVALAQKTQ